MVRERGPIEAWLLKNGMKQGELAKKVGLTQTHLSQVLNFKYPITASSVKKLKKVVPHEIVEKHFNL